MEEKDKPLANPSEQDVSSEEGKDVASKESIKVEIENKEDKELEQEVEDAIKKLNSDDGEKKEEEKVENKDDKKDEIKELTLEEINNLTKRKFESKEDFFKHYENLAAFSGSNEAQDLRKKAKEYDALIEKAGGAENLLTQKTEKKEEKKSVKKKDSDISELIDEKVSSVDKEIKELKQKLEVSDFLKKFPEAETHIDTINGIAIQQKKSLIDVYDGSELQSLIKDSKTLQEVKEKDKGLGVTSKGRLAPSKNQKIDKIARDLILAQREGAKRRDVDVLKRQLVEAKLKIGLEDQKNI